MTHRTIVVSVLCCFLLVSAGCVRVHPPRDSKTAVYYHGSFNESGPQFVMSGSVGIGVRLPAQNSFENLSICLYSRDGDLVHAERLGNWNLEPQNVTIVTDEVPQYVIIDSPYFWDGKIRVEYISRTNDSLYDSQYAFSREELPFSGCTDP